MTSTRTRLGVLAACGVLATAGLVTTAGDASAATPACGNSALSVNRTFVQGGAGHSWMSLVYRNTTHHTCTVSGYPGLDTISKTGHVLAHAKRTLSGYGGGGTLHTVTILPGHYASASVEWLNFNPATSGDCVHGVAVRTVVANTSLVHRLSVSTTACGLQVHPTVTGTPGYPNFGPAQYYWIAGSNVDAAHVNLFLTKAKQQLQAAHVWPTQVAQLAQLISFPPTGLTPAQVAQARADIKALDLFFGTPGKYL
jgi:hypothetical protein